jgi:hypothetical protein
VIIGIKKLKLGVVVRRDLQSDFDKPVKNRTNMTLAGR